MSKKQNHKNIEFEHFNIHSFKNAKIEILDVESDHNKRLQLENMYIIKYQTAYPYGLNDRVNNCSIYSIQVNHCIFQNFFMNDLSSVRTDRVRSLIKNRKTFINFEMLLEEINNQCMNKNNMVKYIKCKILGLRITQAKFLSKFIYNFKFKHIHIRDLIVDLLKYKLRTNKLDTDLNKFDSYLIIDFSHKYMDLLNIPQLLHNPSVKEAFPVKTTYPKISFKYSRTLGSIVYNYTKFSKNVRTEYINEYPCSCNSSPYLDPIHKHVVTGNLNIINDNEIQSIFKFGSKFRLIPQFNVEKIINDIRICVNDYIHKISYMLKLPLGYFNNWKILLLKVILDKINITPNIFPVTIKITKFYRKLKELHSKYIIVPVDKAGSNFSFV